MRRAEHVAHMGNMRNAYKVLVRRAAGMKSLGRPRCRWMDIKVGLIETGCEGMYWIQQAQDSVQWRALLNTLIQFRFTQKRGFS